MWSRKRNAGKNSMERKMVLAKSFDMWLELLENLLLAIECADANLYNDQIRNRSVTTTLRR
jgi:hypothetical protein